MLFLQEENPAKAEKNDHKNGILNHKNQRNNEAIPYVRLTAFSTIEKIIFLGREPTRPRLPATDLFLVRSR